MVCRRCGHFEDQPGVVPAVHLDTVTIQVNDTVDVLRVPLCGFCRQVAVGAFRRALAA